MRPHLGAADGDGSARLPALQVALLGPAENGPPWPHCAEAMTVDLRMPQGVSKDRLVKPTVRWLSPCELDFEARDVPVKSRRMQSQAIDGHARLEGDDWTIDMFDASIKDPEEAYIDSFSAPATDEGWREINDELALYGIAPLPRRFLLKTGR